jgi:mannose-6-phosphate isomerase-like protein (cupin superfamily)
MQDRLKCIRADGYKPCAEELKHVYLVGSLHRPVPHPFFSDERAEVVLCFYQRGDDGEFHWHPDVTEYEYMLEGRMGYFSVADGREEWFEPGDMIYVPAGACVRRLVPTRVRTLTVKLPSKDDKITCRRCDRVCAYRVEERRKE